MSVAISSPSERLCRVRQEVEMGLICNQSAGIGHKPFIPS